MPDSLVVDADAPTGVFSKAALINRIRAYGLDV
jgi:hypothetical protein